MKQEIHSRGASKYLNCMQHCKLGGGGHYITHNISIIQMLGLKAPRFTRLCKCDSEYLLLSMLDV